MRTPKLFQAILGKSGHTTVARFDVQGMTCNHCAERVRKSVQTLPGIAAADISLKDATATVTYHPETISTEQILKQIQAAGYSAKVQNQTH